MPITVKRVYDPPSPTDGLRVLVDRLWPRGLSKSATRINLWARELSPSNELRQWYAHDAEKWPGFKRRFFAELRTRTQALDSLWRAARKGRVTLLFASKEPRSCHASKFSVVASSGRWKQSRNRSIVCAHPKK